MRPATTVGRYHIPTPVRELLTQELGNPLLEDTECVGKLDKRDAGAEKRSTAAEIYRQD